MSTQCIHALRRLEKYATAMLQIIFNIATLIISVANISGPDTRKLYNCLNTAQ